jgi:chromosome segregation ATPase
MDIALVATGLGNFIALLLGHLWGRRKTKEEVKNLNAQTLETKETAEGLRITNLSNTINIYQKVHDELARQLDNVLTKFVALSQDIETIRDEKGVLLTNVIKLEKDNFLLKKEINLLIRQKEELSETIEELTNQLKIYKNES